MKKVTNATKRRVPMLIVGGGYGSGGRAGCQSPAPTVDVTKYPWAKYRTPSFP